MSGKRFFAERDPYSAARPYTRKSGIVNTMPSALRGVSRRSVMAVSEPYFRAHRRKMMDINGMHASPATREVTVRNARVSAMRDDAADGSAAVCG